MIGSSGVAQARDGPKSDCIIDDALLMALMTTRLLRAWHAGETEAEESMELLWEGLWQIRSVSKDGQPLLHPRGVFQRGQPSS
jgi:hypothetical protein